MRHCPECGDDLGRGELEIDGKHQSSLRLIQMLNARDGTLTNFPFPHEDYFRALWSTCRIIGRKLNRFITAGDLDGLEQIKDRHVKGWTIERQSSEVRHTIITNAQWLLDGWPDRFVETCDRAKLSRAEFGGPDNCSPAWFDEVVKRQLAKAVNWITREDVGTAIAEIEAKGLAVSKNALRRRLGITESWAINEVLDQRRDATTDELAKLCEHYHYLIEHTPPSRDQQRTLCRDFLILLCSALTGQRVEKVCFMTRREIGLLHQHGLRYAHTDGPLGTISSTLDELFDQYSHGIRPAFSVRAPEPTQCWFLSRFGKPMDGHSVRARFARMMKDVFEPKLWNSMDVFLRTPVASLRAPDEMLP